MIILPNLDVLTNKFSGSS